LPRFLASASSQKEKSIGSFSAACHPRNLADRKNSKQLDGVFNLPLPRHPAGESSFPPVDTSRSSPSCGASLRIAKAEKMGRMGGAG
jgi:hypothetical protein